jgi:prepilin-type N-terminal cleavage/methylation domain-containing protein/prepilin-type processing-associated H-X9-DG protein
MQAKKGFTLIELLVVIAIIAILAAILFPVFANARDKARQISDLSNIKQLALGEIMYTSDYDDTFSPGVSNDTRTEGWSTNIYPYVSTYDIFIGSDDTSASVAKGYISYGANGFEDYLHGGSQSYKQFLCGVFGRTGSNGNGDNDLNGDVQKLSSITQPTASIMLCDLQDSDLSTLGNGTNEYGTNPAVHNYTTAPMYSLIGNASLLSWSGWNIFSIPKDATGDGSYWEIPSADRSISAAYPGGPNGLVSAPFSSKSLANFAFVDGHAKAQKPVATNPDGGTNVEGDDGVAYIAPNYDGDSWDQNNEWVAIR